jgi:hypothetical protein
MEKVMAVLLEKNEVFLLYHVRIRKKTGEKFPEYCTRKPFFGIMNL